MRSDVSVAFVWGTYVRPEERRRGAARALMEAAIDAAHGAVEQLTLAVVSDNAAAVASDDRYADETLMVRFLLSARRTAAD